MSAPTLNLTLKKGHDFRVRTGHPWIFANELESIPAAARGQIVQIVDSRGQFVAVGYCNPNSQIVVRVLSRAPNLVDADFFYHRLKGAWVARQRLGLTQGCFRWIFAEADFLPGLIIDRYLMQDSQVWVAQISTFGIETLWPKVQQALETFMAEQELPTALIIDRTSSGRRMEGLESLDKKVALNPKELNLRDCKVLVGAHFLPKPVELSVDLIDGQKTGLFLDQTLNQEVLLRLRGFLPTPLRVLDMCSYVGQWGAVLSRGLSAKVEVTCVDISETALKLSVKNIEAAGGTCKTMCVDALKDELPTDTYDLVICDPPAFVKNKKDFEKGKAAYVKLFREAMKRVRPKGVLVAASCSGLVASADFRELLVSAESKSHTQFSWFYQGGHGPDHPQLAAFPQGTYLKCWFGVRN